MCPLQIVSSSGAVKVLWGTLFPLGCLFCVFFGTFAFCCKVFGVLSVSAVKFKGHPVSIVKPAGVPPFAVKFQRHSFSVVEFQGVY